MDKYCGNKYGKLTAIGLTADKRYILCRCTCKAIVLVHTEDILGGKVQSCSLCSDDNKELNTLSRLYFIWSSFMDRCYNTENRHYKNYGAIGIKVSAEWLEFRNFASWGLNQCITDRFFNRIDKAGDYSETNCAFIRKEDRLTRADTTFITSSDGAKHSVREWSTITGIKTATLLNRLTRGWSVDGVLGIEKKVKARPKKQHKAKSNSMFTCRGITKSFADWAKYLGCSQATLYNHLENLDLLLDKLLKSPKSMEYCGVTYDTAALADKLGIPKKTLIRRYVTGKPLDVRSRRRKCEKDSSTVRSASETSNQSTE